MKEHREETDAMLLALECENGPWDKVCRRLPEAGENMQAECLLGPPEEHSTVGPFQTSYLQSFKKNKFVLF